MEEEEKRMERIQEGEKRFGEALPPPACTTLRLGLFSGSKVSNVQEEEMRSKYKFPGPADWK